jgi:hypothetical protein
VCVCVYKEKGVLQCACRKGREGCMGGMRWREGGIRREKRRETDKSEERYKKGAEERGERERRERRESAIS